MGVTPIVGDIIQARIRLRATSQLAMNVLHYRVIAVAGGGLSVSQMAQDIGLQFYAVYKFWMPANADYHSTQVQNLTFPASVQAQDDLILPGIAAGNMVPRQVSGLISLSTNTAGRRERGRIYVGFPSSAYVDANGELTAAGLVILSNIASVVGPGLVVTAGAASTNLQLVIRHPDVPGPPPIVNGSDVTTVRAEEGLATQRRRGDFGRPNIL